MIQIRLTGVLSMNRLSQKRELELSLPLHEKKHTGPLDTPIYRDLPEAVALKQFFLVFQPIVDITEGRIISYESLIRWRHPQHGIISPSEFIPVAEVSGLITAIDLWALETVLSLDFGGIPVHVNFSGYDLLSPGFLDTLSKMIGDQRDKIVLEFTETAQIDFSNQMVQNIKDLGLRLAVDDFGTGYSSMVLLNTLKVNMLKIDIHFIRNMLQDIDSAVITDTIIRLGNSLNMEVIAEGVETYDQLRHLYRNGCRLIQGFLISRPLEYDRLDSFSAEAFKLSPQEKYIRDTDDFVQRYANNALILLELDEELNYIRLTENFCSYLGYPMDSLRGRSFAELITPDQTDYFHFIIQRLMSSGYVDNVVLNLLRKDRSLKSTVFSARLENKTSRSVIVYLEDYAFYNDKIDEINGVRNAYSVMFHEGPLATIVWKSDYEIVDWNSESEQAFGWSRDEAIGKNLLKLILPENQEPIPRAFEDVFTESLVESVNSNLCKNGSTIICRWINRTLRDSEGKIRFIISMVTDITEKLLRDDHVRLLSAAIEKSGSAVIITDADGTVEFSNSRFREISGYEDGLLNRNISLITSREHAEIYYAQLWETISRGGAWHGEFRNRRKDGSFYWCINDIIPVRSTVDGKLKYICIQEDITQTRERETALNDIKRTLEEQSRFSTLGAMLAGIIHEINSPLSIITGNMQFLTDALTPASQADSSVAEVVADIQSGLQHLSHLLGSYKEMAHGDADPRREYFDLHKEVATVLEVTRNEYKYDMFVENRVTDPIFLFGSPGHMRQVLMNLMINAIYSVKKRGHDEPGRVELSALRSGQALHFEVVDNGHGIPPEIISNIFDSFYTTKPSGEGTGLGLSICKHIIEDQFGGSLGVESRPGKTVFFFDLTMPEGQ